MSKKGFVPLLLSAVLLASCVNGTNSSIEVSSNEPSSSEISYEPSTSEISHEPSTSEISSKEEEVHVTSVLLSVAKTTLEVGETTSFDVSVLPANANNKSVSYSLSTENVIRLNGNTIEAIGVGQVNLKAASDDTHVYDEISITVSERKNIVSDKEFISDLKKDEYKIDAYPTTSWGVNEANNVGVDKDKLVNEERYPVPSEGVTTYLAEDYGITPEGDNNAGRLTNLLNSLVDVEGTKVIRLKDNATYYFSNSVNATNVSDCYITGGTNTKCIYTGWMSYFLLTQCSNFHINNLIFDINPSPTITGTVDHVEENSSSAYIYVKPDEGYDLSNSEYSKYSLKKTGSYAEYYYDDEFGAYVPDRYGNLFYNYGDKGLTDLSYSSSTGLLKVSLSKSFPWCTYVTPEKGTIVSVAFQVYESFGFYFKDCVNSYMENVTTYTAGGMGLRTDNGKNVYLNRVNFIREPGTKRLLTCTADILHTCNLAGDAIFSNCVLEGSHDDGINVKTFYTKIAAIKGNVVTVNQTQTEVSIDFEEGDEVDVYNPTGMKYMSTFTVMGVEKIGSNYELTLDRSMPSRGSSSYLGFSLGNATKAVHLTLENSVIKNKRNRGILLQGRNSVIKNCTFSNVNMGAVQVLSVDDTFKEAIVPENVKIYNTKFMNCWDDLQVFTYDASGNATPGTLKNVEVYNNFFYNDTGTTVWLKGVGDISIHNNLFYEKSSKSYSCSIGDASNVNVSDNAYYFESKNLGFNFVKERENNTDITIRENTLKGVL